MPLPKKLEHWIATTVLVLFLVGIAAFLYIAVLPLYPTFFSESKVIVEEKPDPEAEFQAELRDIRGGGGNQRLSADIDDGFYTHDILFKNKSDDVLHDVTLQVFVHRNLANLEEKKQFWEKWLPGEIKKFNVAAKSRPDEFSVHVSGFAFINTLAGTRKKVALEKSWGWGFK